MVEIEEVDGHHIEVQELDQIVHVLHCECGWRHASHREEVEAGKQLHWAAKIVEREVIDEQAAEVQEAVTALRDDPDEQWFAALRAEGEMPDRRYPP